MLDVGIGQEQEVRVQQKRLLDPLLHCPQLARPAGKQRTPADNGNAFAFWALFGSLPHRVSSPVGAVVIDDEDMQRVHATLLQKRRDRRADHIGFIAGGNNDRNHHVLGRNFL